MIDLSVVDGVSVLTMRSGENRLNMDSVTALGDALAEAAVSGAPLVVTGEGKFFSNGLDLEWLQGDGQAHGPDMLARLYVLLADLVVFPGVTVAAINGHAFGGGVMIAGACDFRLMRADRGYFCFPEVDLGMAMSDQFDALIKAKYPSGALWRALVTGHRYGGEEASEAGLVDGFSTEDKLLDRAIELAGAHADKDGAAVGRLKAKHFDALVATLTG
ncbi:MAG: enoyl-CoA hydratase/isomerase family protein [Acidimicrobiales bacterium]